MLREICEGCIWADNCCDGSPCDDYTPFDDGDLSESEYIDDLKMRDLEYAEIIFDYCDGEWEV